MTPFQSRLKDLAALVLQHLDDSGLAGYSAKAGRVVWTGRAERFQLVTDGRTPEEYADNLAGQLFEVFGAGVTINGGAPEFGQVLKGLAEINADTIGIKGALQSLVNKVIGKPDAPPAPAIDPGGRRLLAGIFERPHTDYPYMIDGAFGGHGFTIDVKHALQMLVNNISEMLIGAGGRPVYLTDDDPNVARHNPKTESDSTVAALSLTNNGLYRITAPGENTIILDSNLAVIKLVERLADFLANRSAGASVLITRLRQAVDLSKTAMTVDQFNSIHGAPLLSLNHEKYSEMYHLWHGGAALVATDASLPEALQNMVNYIWLNWHIAKKD